MTKYWRSLLAVMAAGALVMTGCSGSDGKDGVDGRDGVDGEQGPPGPPGQDGEDGKDSVFTSIESCAGCHDGDLEEVHQRSEVVVSNVRLQAATGDNTKLALTFNVKVDGVNRNDFVRIASAHTWRYSTSPKGGVRANLDQTAYPVTVTQNWNGNYTLTIDNAGPGATTPIVDGTTLMFTLNTGNSTPMATVVAHVGGAPSYSAVSDQACINCHGTYVFRSGSHHSANPKGVEACMVCHNRNTNAETRLGGTGTRLMGYVHGIHNSHNMPDGVYSRNGSTSASSQFSIGFPGFMQNCSTCHDSEERLALVNAAPVSWATCISCHDSWDGFPNTVEGGTLQLHRSYTSATNCADCHNAEGARDVAAKFHNGTFTGRNGLIWDGEDQSVVIGKKIAMSIDEITVADGKLSVKWSAKFDGAAVNPCNSDFAAGPVFFGATANASTGAAASNMSFLRVYALANDWVGAPAGTSPGQPAGAVTLTSSNTTCSGDVATTVLDAENVTATRGAISLQGKPQIRFEPANRVIQVRAPSPVREFVPATGEEPTEKRRKIVDTAKCEACHLGSLYQHGGNRVDSVELCVMCHNPASSDKNWRATYGVDPSEAYDGKAAETYDLRVMLHAIHSAGQGAPWVLYRGNNGIYAFGSEESIANLRNWPGAGSHVVYGSDDVTRNHNEIVVHYPRALNDCAACHADGWVQKLPNPTKAVAVTVDAGAEPWNELDDDVLMGAGAASCMSCHSSADPVEQFIFQVHAYGNGWVPATFENGRQTILDAVNLK